VGEEIELQIVETGTPVEATVVDIVRGKCKDLVPVDRIRSDAIRQRWQRMADRDCIQIAVDVGGMVYYLFPIVVSNNPRSTFYRLLKAYGTKDGNVYRLKKGSRIKVVINERGFPRVYLP